MSNNSVALVTGAGSGIGRAIAIMLSEHGFNVALAGRHADRLMETASYLSKESEHIEVVADVGEASDVSHMIDQTVKQLGRLDVLVNNAGHAPSLPIELTTPNIIDEVYRVNAMGPAYAIVNAWPIFQRQYRNEGKAASIINISTMGTQDPFPGFFAYASAKASVNLMIKSCVKEGAAMGIRAFAIAPGAVETKMLRAIFSKEELPSSNCLSPLDVANVVLECVSGDRDSQNGETIFLFP